VCRLTAVLGRSDRTTRGGLPSGGGSVVPDRERPVAGYLHHLRPERELERPLLRRRPLPVGEVVQNFGVDEVRQRRVGCQIDRIDPARLGDGEGDDGAQRPVPGGIERGPVRSPSWIVLSAHSAPYTGVRSLKLCE